MTLADMAAKLGFKYSKKKNLVEGNNNSFYTRTDHVLTPDNGKPPIIFRDAAAVNLFLLSKTQVDLEDELRQDIQASRESVQPLPTTGRPRLPKR